MQDDKARAASAAASLSTPAAAPAEPNSAAVLDTPVTAPLASAVCEAAAESGSTDTTGELSALLKQAQPKLKRFGLGMRTGPARRVALGGPQRNVAADPAPAASPTEDDDDAPTMPLNQLMAAGAPPPRSTAAAVEEEEEETVPLPTSFASHRRTPSRAAMRVVNTPAPATVAEEEEVDEDEAEAPTCPLPPAAAMRVGAAAASTSAAQRAADAAATGMAPTEMARKAQAAVAALAHSAPEKAVTASPPQSPAPPARKAAAAAAVTKGTGQSQAGERRVREDDTTVHVRGVRYTKLECVGQGGSSKVFKVMTADHKMFALKRIRLSGCEKDAVSGFEDEIRLLTQLKGLGNIIQLVDYEVSCVGFCSFNPPPSP